MSQAHYNMQMNHYISCLGKKLRFILSSKNELNQYTQQINVVLILFLCL